MDFTKNYEQVNTSDNINSQNQQQKHKGWNSNRTRANWLTSAYQMDTAIKAGWSPYSQEQSQQLHYIREKTSPSLNPNIEDLQAYQKTVTEILVQRTIFPPYPSDTHPTASKDNLKDQELPSYLLNYQKTGSSEEQSYLDQGSTDPATVPSAIETSIEPIYQQNTNEDKSDLNQKTLDEITFITNPNLGHRQELAEKPGYSIRTYAEKFTQINNENCTVRFNHETGLPCAAWNDNHNIYICCTDGQLLNQYNDRNEVIRPQSNKTARNFLGILDSATRDLSIFKGDPQTMRYDPDESLYSINLADFKHYSNPKGTYLEADIQITSTGSSQEQLYLDPITVSNQENPNKGKSDLSQETLNEIASSLKHKEIQQTCHNLRGIKNKHVLSILRNFRDYKEYKAFYESQTDPLKLTTWKEIQNDFKSSCERLQEDWQTLRKEEKEFWKNLGISFEKNTTNKNMSLPESKEIPSTRLFHNQMPQLDQDMANESSLTIENEANSLIYNNNRVSQEISDFNRYFDQLRHPRATIENIHQIFHKMINTGQYRYQPMRLVQLGQNFAGKELSIDKVSLYAKHCILRSINEETERIPIKKEDKLTDDEHNLGNLMINFVMRDESTKSIWNETKRQARKQARRYLQSYSILQSEYNALRNQKNK